jgi:integrase
VDAGDGLRIGEALAVSWPDVELEARTVEVDSKLIRIKVRGCAMCAG